MCSVGGTPVDEVPLQHCQFGCSQSQMQDDVRHAMRDIFAYIRRIGTVDTSGVSLGRKVLRKAVCYARSPTSETGGGGVNI